MERLQIYAEKEACIFHFDLLLKRLKASMEDSVEMPIGHTASQDNAFEQPEKK